MTKLSSQITAAQVSLSNLPERTVWVDDTVLQVVSTSSGFSNPPVSTPYLEAMSYRDSNGVYFLRFSGHLVLSGGADNTRFGFFGCDFNIGNIFRAFSAWETAAERTLYAQGENNQNRLIVQATGNMSVISIAGDVQLASKPSWFDANREAGFSVAAQIESATANSKGLLPPPSQMTDELATSLGHKEYFHGTAYNSGISPTVSNLTVDRAVFIPYQVQSGDWRLKFTITGTGSGSNDAIGVNVNGVLFKNVTNYFQAISVLDQGTQGTTGRSHSGRVNANTDVVAALFETVISLASRFSFSGDVELESKPTWAY